MCLTAALLIQALAPDLTKLGWCSGGVSATFGLWMFSMAIVNLRRLNVKLND